MAAHKDNDKTSSSWAAPPPPPEAEDMLRVGEQGKRRAIMDGTWESLLRGHTKAQIGAKRTAMVGLMDISSNLLLQFIRQIATLYRRKPKVTHDNDAGLELMETHLKKSKTWGLAKRNQERTLGIREHLMIAGWKGGDEKDGGRLVMRTVSPDFTWGEEHPNDTTQYGSLYEAREREVTLDADKDGVRITKTVWTWDWWDVREPDEDHPDRPFFKILSADQRTDFTAQFLDPDEWQGERYPYRNESKQPIIPATLYHASPHEGLFAWHEMSEVVFGTLQDALNWTQVNHGFKIGSFAQRYVAGGRIKGGVVKQVAGGKEKVEVITADPSVALEIASDGEGAVVVGQWAAAVDIDKAERFARSYGARLAVHFGLSPSDVTFDTRSPSSGVSLTVSRQGQREQQAAQAPQFRDGDEQMLMTISAVLRAHGIKVPEDGYTIEYATIELSPDERRTILENLREELEMGLTTKVDAWLRLHPGASESEAKKALEDVAEEIEAEKPAAPEPAPEPAPGTGDSEETGEPGTVPGVPTGSDPAPGVEPPS